jgi:predicted dehydrogenase
LKNEHVAAFCDVDEVRGREDLMRNVDERQTRPLLEKFSDSPWFKDYRVMLEKMADKLDGVVVSTPDHMHATIALTAIAHGKNVYVEKPLCRCLTEVRTLQRAAAVAGVVTQMGNQGRASEGIRIAREWVQAGVIGNVTRVDTFSNRPVGPWFLDPEFDPDASPDGAAPPATLDWNLWLGAAPTRPYRKDFLPMHWRGFVDYGCGSLGDMGCHQIDAAFYALDLGAPTSIDAVTTQLYPKTFPKSSVITFRFPARRAQPRVELRWIDGGLMPPRPMNVSAGEWKNPRNGSIFTVTGARCWWVRTAPRSSSCRKSACRSCVRRRRRRRFPA